MGEKIPCDKIIFAHRGSSIDAPENTLSAFRLAKKQNAHGFEFDVQLSRDGHVVVTHDNSFKRYRIRKKVRKLTLPEIKNIDVGRPLKPEFPTEYVPTLEEVLEQWKKGETPRFMQLEIKNHRLFGRRLESKTVSILKKFNRDNPGLKLFNYLIVISFNPISLAYFRKKLPSIKRGILVTTYRQGFRKTLAKCFRLRAGADFLIPDKRMLNPRFVKRYTRKYKLGAYTIESEKDFQRIKDLDLWGITTKDPSFCRANDYTLSPT